MERFTLSKESAIGPYMGTDPNGAWCHWDAVKARIAALEAQVKALTEERDAQAEAVRVLAAEVNAAWNWNDADMYDRPDTWDHATSNAVRANPIARAAVEGGSK